MDMTTVNCETGEIAIRRLTKGEAAAVKARESEARQEMATRAEAEQQRQQDIDAFLSSLPEEAREAAKRLLRL